MADEAAKREARKRRILGRGGDRLSRITNAGRGADYELIDNAPMMPKMPSEAADINDDPPETLPFAPPQTMLAGAPEAMNGMHPPQDDPLAQLMAAMQGQGGGAPDMMNMMQQMMSGMGSKDAPQGMQGASTAHREQSEAVDKRLRLVQYSVVFIFAFYLVIAHLFVKPKVGIAGRAVDVPETHAFQRSSYLQQWASLAWEYTPSHAWQSSEDLSMFPWRAMQHPLDKYGHYVGLDSKVLGVLPTWPVYYVFFTLEVALQGMRIVMLQRFPASPSGRIAGILQVWAPALLPYVTLALSLASLVSSMVDDMCILLFAIGLGVLFSNWELGV
ncbi:hypothetical protein MVES1_003651 [Malassezia vespertilionis]|uniref:Uncharacterized protein n=1 Tax=Malassezia vespertilionis TaxID=2020962 RepID=A0A2N1J8M9_9BASI|nr:uncharacterized protein MVES1_003651 [Malassezia vespertilionis]PKI82894.1 hypothetical protein MVES_003219 [Malassezia vespertilionis]WFD08279.1 hypothetical protein MVES1_003651 [Malassezia vespertilionis]